MNPVDGRGEVVPGWPSSSLPRFTRSVVLAKTRSRNERALRSTSQMSSLSKVRQGRNLGR
jgi:hypothetical protein